MLKCGLVVCSETTDARSGNLGGCQASVIFVKLVYRASDCRTIHLRHTIVTVDNLVHLGFAFDS